MKPKEENKKDKILKPTLLKGDKYMILKLLCTLVYFLERFPDLPTQGIPLLIHYVNGGFFKVRYLIMSVTPIENHLLTP